MFSLTQIFGRVFDSSSNALKVEFVSAYVSNLQADPTAVDLRVVVMDGSSGLAIKAGTMTIAEIIAAAGSSTTPYQQVPTATGDPLVYTLDHAPAANTLKLFRNGILLRRVNAGASADQYTLSGNVITLGAALESDQSLDADLSY